MIKEPTSYELNKWSRMYVLSSFAMKAAVQGDIAAMLEHIDGLEDDEKERLVQSALMLIKHTSGRLALARSEAQQYVDALRSEV